MFPFNLGILFSYAIAINFAISFKLCFIVPYCVILELCSTYCFNLSAIDNIISVLKEKLKEKEIRGKNSKYINMQ